MRRPGAAQRAVLLQGARLQRTAAFVALVFVAWSWADQHDRTIVVLLLTIAGWFAYAARRDAAAAAQIRDEGSSWVR